MRKFGVKVVVLVAGLLPLLSCPAVSTPKPDEIDTAETEDLVNRIGHQPELMDIKFLNYYIGRPEKNRANDVMLSKHYLWYRPDHNGVKYELVQEQSEPGQVVESTFIFHTDDLKLDLSDVEQKFGKIPHLYYDQMSCATAEYTFAPNTLMSFTQRKNTFQVKRISIHYQGAPLPPPSPQDMMLGLNNRRTQAVGALQNKDYKQSLALLREHLGEHPEDLEAHVSLAQALKQNCQLNEAIAQYKYALTNAGDNQTVRAACVQGLQELRVIPSVPSDSQVEHHDIDVVHHGQRFKQADLVGTQPMDSPQRPGYQPSAPTNMSSVLPGGVPPIGDLSTSPLPGLGNLGNIGGSSSGGSGGDGAVWSLGSGTGRSVNVSLPRIQAPDASLSGSPPMAPNYKTGASPTSSYPSTGNPMALPKTSTFDPSKEPF